MEDSKLQNEGRREFVKRAILFTAALTSLVGANCSCEAQTERRSLTGIVGGGCDGCEGIYEGMPQQLSERTEIASAAEPGERLEMGGTIYLADGKTPAPNVILYVYHTDATGHYSPAPNAAGYARRHGHLRGWMKTSADGAYRFMSIKPAPYPGRDIPAHIHPVVKEPDRNEYYIDEYVFEDDPLLTREKRSKLENRGSSGVVRLTRNGSFWTGRRDIILGLNIPN